MKLKVVSSNIDCGGDFIKIHNYQNEEIKDEVASICGSETEVVISDTNSVYIIFTSDASITASGFKIRYCWKRAPQCMIHGLLYSVGRAISKVLPQGDISSHLVAITMQWCNMHACFKRRRFTRCMLVCVIYFIPVMQYTISSTCNLSSTVLPALGDPRRERTPVVFGHIINVPTHCNVNLPPVSGHLPNADAGSHLLVVST